MNHLTTPQFWQRYNALPTEIRRLADKNFALLRENPHHRSLQFKKIEDLWSARVGQHYRALAYEDGDDLVWFWIGSHAAYDSIVP